MYRRQRCVLQEALPAAHIGSCQVLTIQNLSVSYDYVGFLVLKEIWSVQPFIGDLQ